MQTFSKHSFHQRVVLFTGTALEYYPQTDGTAMSNSLSFFVANISINRFGSLGKQFFHIIPKFDQIMVMVCAVFNKNENLDGFVLTNQLYLS